MTKPINLARTRSLLFGILKPEKSFFYVAITYGLAIGLMTLAVPIAVQTLINSIVNIASVRAVVILSLVLFSTLVISGVFSALRIRIMELYERRVYSRLTAKISLRTIMAPHSYFEGRRNITMTQRYFDIMVFQKNMPALMIDGFAFLLQMLVGFTLVSFYHPALFVFNVLIILIMYCIWKIWGPGAKRTAIALSNAKYETAKWLNDIASAHEFFKSARHLDLAAERTEERIANYVTKHEKHFVFTFSQTIMFLLLYAFSSAALLGVGGWLVVQGQLSIGQLVAAELIMSAVFLGLSRFTEYLKMYYELYGSAEKISALLEIPQEEQHRPSSHVPTNSRLVFDNVYASHHHKYCKINTTIEAGAKLIVDTDQNWVQRSIVSLLKRFDSPEKGMILLGDKSVADYDIYELRQSIASIDRALIIECTIEDYLRMSAPDVTDAQIIDALEFAEMHSVIDALPDGLKTRLSSVGAPLTSLEFLLLKLASVKISSPKVMILNQHFDAIPDSLRLKLLSRIKTLPTTVLYFSNNTSGDVLDGSVTLDQATSENQAGLNDE